MQSVIDMHAREGIAVAGTILVDKLYEIVAYPQVGELTGIQTVSFAAGGMVPNDATDLRTLAPELPVCAIGKIGNDAEGRLALEWMIAAGVDISAVRISDTEKTGFTDVMSITGGQRTFFTYAGTNATFGYEDIPWEKLSCKMLHLGYFLLLDRVDRGDGLKILKTAKDRGIMTSIDLVSENSDRYACVLPCLPYVDYLIVNETEAGRLCGMKATADNLFVIANRLLELGVRERVIIHTPVQAICKTRQGSTVLPSYQLPVGWIKGTTGAGDAFCSGALVGIYYDRSDAEILEYAHMAAVASLRTTDATGGVTQLDNLKEIVKNLKRNKK